MPSSRLAYFNRGNAYDDKSDDAKALADLEAAIRLDPKNAAALTVRGVVWRRKGDIERAVADFTAGDRARSGIRDRIREPRRCMGGEGR